MNKRQKDLEKARFGILQAKKEHLAELNEKDLHGLKLTYVAQVNKKNTLDRKIESIAESKDSIECSNLLGSLEETLIDSSRTRQLYTRETKPKTKKKRKMK